MKTSKRIPWWWPAAVCGLTVMVAGCSIGETQAAPDAGSPLFVTPTPDTTRFSGFSWDPEAFFFALASCGGPSCPAPPQLSSGNPLFMLSEVQGAQVQLLDTNDGSTLPQTTLSGADGTWTLDGVPSRTPPAAPLLLAAAGGSAAPYQGPPLPFPPAPAANAFLPTLALRPIMPNYSACFFQQAPVISDQGALDALAKYLTAQGTPTRVQDFVDPTKFGGVAVWWLYQPGSPDFVLPAFDTTVTSSLGTVYNLDWAPPGALPAGANQSARGYYVAAGASVSPIGLSVITLPPGAAFADVTVTPTDLTTDPTQGRPWVFGGLDVLFPPGMISFAPLQLASSPPPGDPPPTDGEPQGDGLPPWLCGM